MIPLRTQEQVERFENGEVRDKLAALIVKERERLSAVAPWWADIVFISRDIRSVCLAIHASGNEELAEILGSIASKTLEVAINHAYPELDEDGKDRIVEGVQIEAEQVDRNLSKLMAEEIGIELPKEH